MKLEAHLSCCTKHMGNGSKISTGNPMGQDCQRKMMMKIFPVVAPSENFLNRPPPAQVRAPRINRWNPMKLESFCTQRKLSESLQNESLHPLCCRWGGSI